MKIFTHSLRGSMVFVPVVGGGQVVSSAQVGALARAWASNVAIAVDGSSAFSMTPGEKHELLVASGAQDVVAQAALSRYVAAANQPAGKPAPGSEVTPRSQQELRQRAKRIAARKERLATAE